MAKIAVSAQLQQREAVEYVPAAEFLRGFVFLTSGNLLFNLTGDEEIPLFAIPKDNNRVSFELCSSQKERRPALEFTIRAVNVEEQHLKQSGKELSQALQWFNGMLEIGQALVGERDSGPAWLKVKMPGSRIRPGFGINVNPADDSPVTVNAIPHAIPRAISIDPKGFKFNYSEDKFKVVAGPNSVAATGIAIEAKKASLYLKWNLRGWLQF